MRRFRDLPIKHKLTLIILVISGMALLLASGAFVTFEQITFRREMVRNLSISARMIGFNSSAALSFNSPESAAETLQGLGAQPHIVAACIYDMQGKVFAVYQVGNASERVWPSIPKIDLERFGPDSLELFNRIQLDGETIGTIFLQSDLVELRSRWQRYGVTVGVILLTAVLLAWWLAARLQRVISEPILQLAAIAERVALENDYSARAVKRTNDELGRLIDGFNHMLAQIQARDAALQRANDKLESHVQERTAQLQAEVTERNRVAAALEVSEKFLHSLLEHLPLNIYRKDTAGRLIFANQHYCERRGLPLAELLGKTDFDLSPAQLAIQYDQDNQSVIENRQPIERVEEQTRPDGTRSWIQIIKVPVIDGDGGVIGTQGMYWDITERKQAEADLEGMHQRLLVVSRHAGMAEVATGVLHNVGNVLNSVNVSANLITDHVRKSKVGSLTRVVALLLEHAADPAAFLTSDARGKQVPAYLGQLAAHLAAEQQVIVAEVEELRQNIEHIKEIVAMQQSYAKVSGAVETINVADLVEDAVRMNVGALARHRVELAREFLPVPDITVDKHKVLQILVNLIRNAKYACDDSGQVDKRMTLGISQTPAGVCLTVRDNGVGIPAENLTRIFNHGFTTRKDGHGFGLHSGALAAKEMGGALIASSAGPGLGASFTLELPFSPA